MAWLVILTVCSVSPAGAQCEAHLVAGDSAVNDLFGDSVDMHAGVAVVGAPLGDDSGSASGAAYVYRFNGTIWYQQQKLLASDAAAGDEFGRSVAVHGNTIVVGSPLEDAGGNAAGAVYVFRYDGSSWTQTQKIIASDAFAFDKFGTSVAVHGEALIVGAPDAHSPDPEGQAYVYRDTGAFWVEDQILTASDGTGYDRFGASVSISGDVAVVGAYATDASTGSAYVYEYNGSVWLQDQILTASDAGAGNEFGRAVDVSGDAIVVGSPLDQDLGPNTGSVYVFRRGAFSWSQEDKFVGEYSYTRLGTSVSIDGGIVAAGATSWGGPDGGGRAFVYRLDGSWTLDRPIGDSAFAFDNFGSAIAVSAGAVLVGSRYGDDGPLFDSGAADVFGRPAVASFRNGNFSDASGEGWCFVDRSDSGAVDFSAGELEVTGGSDDTSTNTITYVQQAFDLHTESNYRCTFDWSYSSTDTPGYDGAFYNIIDAKSGASVTGWSVTLSDTDGESGSASVGFTGSGQFLLRLGVFTSDNLFGPGIVTIDNVNIICDETPGPLTNGSFSDESGVPWCFTDTSRNGAADFVGFEGIVTGGNDGITGSSATYLEQELSVGSGTRTCSFTWEYDSVDSAGYDAAVWDIVDRSTGLSVVAGPITLSDISGESGSVATNFSGSGLYVLRLGVTSTDNVFGAGVASFGNVAVVGAATSLIRGDANTDGGFDISDAIFLLDFLFIPGSATPPCMDSADTNDDGSVNLADAVTVLGNLFSGGAPIAAPHPGCGPDPTPDGLGCASFPTCP